MTITTTLPPKGTTYTLPPDWVNQEMKMQRMSVHLQAAVVDTSRYLMQVITWAERMQDELDEMKKSLSSSTQEEETEPEEQEEQDDGTTTETRATTKAKNRLLSPNKIL